jgi:ParB-like chromosome segregation protein Spo0J
MARYIELWPIERLIPYARNARTHSDAQIAQIASSIREFGFNSPILVEFQCWHHCRPRPPVGGLEAAT